MKRVVSFYSDRNFKYITFKQMPYARLQYNGDNQYTTKDKRNLLLTQEAIEKINSISSGWENIDAIIESGAYVPYPTKTLTELEDEMSDVYALLDELNRAPREYYNAFIDAGVLWDRENIYWITLSTDGQNIWSMGVYWTIISYDTNSDWWYEFIN